MRVYLCIQGQIGMHCLAKSDLPSQEAVLEPVQEPVGKVQSPVEISVKTGKQPQPWPLVLCVVSPVCWEPHQIIHYAQWIRTLQGVAGACGTAISFPFLPLPKSPHPPQVRASTEKSQYRKSTWRVRSSLVNDHDSVALKTLDLVCQMDVEEFWSAG